jgi:hypothetical protein
MIRESNLLTLSGLTSVSHFLVFHVRKIAPDSTSGRILAGDVPLFESDALDKRQPSATNRFFTGGQSIPDE